MLDSSVRSALSALIVASEDYLMGRILAYAKEQGYTKYTSTLKEAWRLSIQGLSASVVGALGAGSLRLELSPEDNFVGDPICDFAVAEAVAHRKRGVTLPMFLGLFKYYRQVYLDLVLEHHPTSTPDKMAMIRFLDRAFDRMEIAYCQEWSSHGEGRLLEELQVTNREVTNEKNAYLTVFESLSDPVVLIDGERRIQNLNLAAARLLDPLARPGQIYYNPAAQ